MCYIGALPFRYWCRLVGHRYDLQRWASDPHCKPQLEMKRPYSVAALRDNEKWLGGFFDSWARKHLPNAQFFLPVDGVETGANESVRNVPRALFESGLAPEELRPEESPIRLMCIWPPRRAVGEDSAVPFGIKEVVVTRQPPTVEVFNIVEHGRFVFSMPCYASDLHNSLCTSFLASSSCLSVTPTKRNGTAAMLDDAGNKKGTLTIIRNIFPELGCSQRFVPSRFLHGLIPACFLEQYEFWQNIPPGTGADASETPEIAADFQGISLCRDTILGYPRPDREESSDDSGEHYCRSSKKQTLDASLLRISVIPAGNVQNVVADFGGKIGLAVAIVQRFTSMVPLTSEKPDKKGEQEENIASDTVLGITFRAEQRQRFTRLHELLVAKEDGVANAHVQCHTLLNLKNCCSSSHLAQLRDSLLRLEDLSHILVWSASNVNFHRFTTELTVDLIEFPRLGLSFTKTPCDEGFTRERSRTCVPELPTTDSEACQKLSTSLSTTAPPARNGCADMLLQEDSEKKLSCSKKQQFSLETDYSFRFQCEQHAGLFLTPRVFSPNSSISQLTGSIPNGIILEDNDGELHLLVDCIAKPILTTETRVTYTTHAGAFDDEFSGGEFRAGSFSVGIQHQVYESVAYDAAEASASEKVAPEVLLDRHDPHWLQNLGDSRHYLYAIHASRCFIFAPTSSSALYLLLLRFIHGEFEEVCKSADAAHLFDIGVEPEENQIWAVLNTLDANKMPHPDAHATRLKLWLNASRQTSLRQPCREALSTLTNAASAAATAAVKKVVAFRSRRKAPSSKEGVLDATSETSNVQARTAGLQNPSQLSSASLCAWTIEQDVICYVQKLNFVSGACRLTAREELEVLRMFPSLIQSSVSLRNRQVLLQTLIDAEKKKNLNRSTNDDTRIVVSSRSLYVPSVPHVDDFDACPRDRTALDGSYNPAEFVAGVVGSMVLFKRPEEPLAGTDATSFFLKTLDRGNLKLFSDFHFLYELLTEGCHSMLAVIPGEPTYLWGALLTRFLSSWDFKTYSQLMSLLRIVLCNPRLTNNWPHLKDDKKHKLSLGFVMRSQETFQRFLKELILHLQQQENAKLLQWPELPSWNFSPQSQDLVLRGDNERSMPRRLALTFRTNDTSCASRTLSVVNVPKYVSLMASESYVNGKRVQK